MALFLRPARPRAAMSDIAAFFARRERHNIPAALAAMAMPALIIYAFVVDARNFRVDPVVIYAESWPLDRSVADIRERQRIFALADNERRALRREQMQRLAEQLGVDYDRREAARQAAITEENRQRLGRPDDDFSEARPANR